MNQLRRAAACCIVSLAASACLNPDRDASPGAPSRPAHTGGAAGASALPVPPGPGDLPRPSGTSANLHVLPWAGFGAAVSYTFDDSQPSQIEHWPELKAEHTRVTFYVNPSGNWYPGYDATWRDAIAQGDEIGNHTVHHCHADLAGCSNNAGGIEPEIDQCSTYIETQLGQPDVWTFAFPFGDAGYAPAAKSRFLLARGVNSGSIAAGDTTDPFNLPTIGAAGGEAASVFSADIDGALAQQHWLILLFHSILPTTQNWYAGVDIAAITGSMEHAKGLGRVWLGSVIDIGAYFLGQRAFEASPPNAHGDNTSWHWQLPAHFPPGRSLRVAVDGGTLSQNGRPLVWDAHGYYEIALDAGSLHWSR